LEADLRLLEFTKRSVRSVWALELLLLIRGQRSRTWSMRELVGELRASEAVVTGVLSGFERDGLVARDARGAVRFAPEEYCIDQLCDALAEAYRERPLAVINVITRPDDQIESLAEAFRFRDEPG
jgi:hypothetical protein